MPTLKFLPRFFLPVAIMLALCFVTGCLGEHSMPKHCERSAIVLGTAARLSAEGDEAEAAVAECLEALSALSSEFDAESPKSSVAKLNAAAGTGEWIPLSPRVWHVLVLSRVCSEATDGAWDATIGPLSALWRKALAVGIPPSAAEVAEALEHIGWKKLELRNEDKSARLTDPCMTLDLGGVLKGCALDECRKIYAKHHATGLINLGESSIAAVGGKKDGKPFRIALRHPREAAPARLGVLGLKNAVLSTSGDYEHFFISDGARYHHILDTRTGFPAKNGVSSVSVRIGAEEPDAGLISDMLSTAFFVMGTEKSLALLPSLPVRAEAVFADETDVVAEENFLRE
ncbi:MAG: FAD:protein FMN transferase [Schwartzia sp.]|nr:FAD:protein FMN transferase [Schwartzia sp. (in: firmicutes)]